MAGRLILVVLALCLFVCHVVGDCYMQSPRGSNDRLNEEGDRQNAQRLFDSQNNARGGYCWGPPMSYVEGSILPIQWTSQHGCGGPHVTCTEVIQYMCTDSKGPETNLLRDGTTIQTIPEDATGSQTKNADGTFVYGMMENYQYYQDCKARERNKGLFIADQKVGPTATRTRQNPNGQRYGFECAEEKDYYPYWHPSPWKDIAVLVPTMEHCKFYQSESQNVKPKNYCKGANLANNALNPNYEQACNAAGGQWVAEPAFGIPPPECKLAHFARDNHLGNVEGGAETANYTWILPTAEVESCVKEGTCNCAVRIRYNITTNESTGLNGEFLDARRNKVLRNDPTVPVEDWEYTLAINTAQFGRTFQDRSFMFHISPRPKGVSKNTKIYNLNVRGKRGNIVQTFPATEYDFTPNRLTVEEGDIVHFQWTGCDTNPQNNDGEGLKRTDRSNIVQIKDLDSNIPVAATNQTVEKMLFESAFLRNRMALIGQTGCVRVDQIQGDADQDLTNCAILNAAKTPYFDGGLVRMNQTGKFTYMSTRNNNFSNRTQKGQLVVEPKKKLSSGAAAGIAIAVIGVVAAAAIGGLVFYGKRHPHSTIGRAVDKVKMPSFSRSSSSSSSSGPSVKERKAALLSDHN